MLIKKPLLAITGICALSAMLSCRSLHDSGSGQEPILFNLADESSKGLMAASSATGQGSVPEAFGLSAHLGNDAPYVADYLWNMKVSASGGKWSGEAPMLWANGQTVRFFAYSPYVAQASGTGVLSITEAGEVPEIHYAASEEAGGQIDILAASAVGSEGSISLTFRHILSCIRFAVGQDFSEGVSIGSISLSNVAGKCSYNMAEGCWGEPESYGTFINSGIGFTMTSGTHAGTLISETPFLLPPQSFGSSSAATIDIAVSENGTEEVKSIPLAGISWKEGYSYTLSLAYSGGSFSISGTEEVQTGSSTSALGELKYTIEGTADRTLFLKEGGSGSISVKSMKSENYVDTSPEESDISWSLAFSTDGGVSWSSAVPDMFTSFSCSGNGSADGDLLKYTLGSSSVDRHCIVRLTQDVSGKTYTAEIDQYVTMIPVEYAVSASGQEVNVCTAVSGNIPAVVYEDGTMVVNGGTDGNWNYRRTFSGTGIHKAALVYDSRATTLEELFSECPQLTSVDLSELDTGAITSFRKMFSGCSGLTGLDLSSFDTGKAESMAYMFAGCSSIEYVELSYLCGDSLRKAGCMFMNCSRMRSVRLWSVSLAHLDPNTSYPLWDNGLERMFYGCSTLAEVYLDMRDMPSNVSCAQMFYGCPPDGKLIAKDLKVPDNVKAQLPDGWQTGS